MFLADIEADIVRKYLSGMSTPEIAREYGTYKNAIRRCLMSQGVVRRHGYRKGGDPTYNRLHWRIRQDLRDDECWACGTTTGPFINACVNPTRWAQGSGSGASSWMLVGESVDDYRRMCKPCSFTYDARINREALAEFFGVPLPCS